MKKIYLASPKMHGEEINYIKEAIDSNWVSTVGENINEAEKIASTLTGCPYAVALSSGTAALHLSIKLAGVKKGDKVFCSDLTFDATVNPVVYEGGIPVFIDSEYESWNMDPAALKEAFRLHPETKTVILAHLYGSPGRISEIRDICKEHGAVLIEDAAEAFGAYYDSKPAGSFGDYGILSFNGNKIITGSSGGMLLCHSKEAADKARKWSTQSREAAPWYQHEELGYNYRMSNIIAGIIRGQLLHLDEHIDEKKRIFQRYKEAFLHLPAIMNPFDEKRCKPNYWLSCLLIDANAMCRQVRSERSALYISENKKSCPTEILEALSAINAEGRPIWKPMHMQPIYRNHPFVTRHGDGRAQTNAYIDGNSTDAGMDIFDRGLCLPSDINMTEGDQDRIIDAVVKCFE